MTRPRPSVIEVQRTQHLTDRQLRHRRQGMLEQLQRGRALPGAFKLHLFQVVFDQFTYPRRAVHVWDDFEQPIGLGQ